MLLAASAPGWGQEGEADPAFQKIPDGVEESVYAPVPPGEGPFLGARIEPPSWFVDLPTREVEVLLYDEGVGAAALTLEGAGATLVGTETFPNDNYLLAAVRIDEGAAPTTLTFAADDGRRYEWPLVSAAQPADPLSAADLVYLVMPDRFANGDPGNDVVDGAHDRTLDRERVFYRHGGDLAGVTARLGYLDSLGATALWLNPVLANDQPYESYHGYAVTDHYAIDARLGDDGAYETLVAEAAARDLKVLMDVVPNHVGDRHFLYADMPDSSWWHLPDTFTRSNFRIPSVLDPHAADADERRMLDGWFDRHMPDFDQASPHVRRYLTQVALWWIGRSGHAGYRVDTYPYSDPAFMAEWSAEIRRNYPEVSFFGEVWVDGLPNQAAFVPGIDTPVPIGANGAVTDFQLYDALHAALSEEQSWAGGVGKLWLTLAQDWVYDDPNALVTFLDNHDLTRLATRLDGDTARLKSALTLLLTLRGTPMLYYGTEVGTEGSGGGFGEGGRKDMPGGWAGDATSAFTGAGLSAQQRALQTHVRRIGTYRKAHPGPALGEMTHFVPEDGVYVYARTAQSDSSGGLPERWLVMYNSAREPRRVAMGRFAEVLEGYIGAEAVVGEGPDAAAGGLPGAIELPDAVELPAGTATWWALR